MGQPLLTNSVKGVANPHGNIFIHQNMMTKYLLTARTMILPSPIIRIHFRFVMHDCVILSF